MAEGGKRKREATEMLLKVGGQIISVDIVDFEHLNENCLLCELLCVAQEGGDCNDVIELPQERNGVRCSDKMKEELEVVLTKIQLEFTSTAAAKEWLQRLRYWGVDIDLMPNVDVAFALYAKSCAFSSRWCDALRPHCKRIVHLVLALIEKLVDDERLTLIWRSTGGQFKFIMLDNMELRYVSTAGPWYTLSKPFGYTEELTISHRSVQFGSSFMGGLLQQYNGDWKHAHNDLKRCLQEEFNAVSQSFKCDLLVVPTNYTDAATDRKVKEDRQVLMVEVPVDYGM